MWEDLRKKISELPPFLELSQKLARRGAGARAGGLTGSSRSLVLSTLAPLLGRGIVVVASDPVKARDIAADLDHFGAGRVIFYPEDEILPYDYHDPDRNLTGMQMAALAAMAEKRCDVLVCTPASLLKKVFAPGLFLDLLADLVTGDEKDPYELAETLVHLGYERHGIVEEKGQFALRGGILDLFEVTSVDPVRMEFDGDEITSIRSFDIETQRSIAAAGSIRVHPLHHLVPDREGISETRSLSREGERRARGGGAQEDDASRRAARGRDTFLRHGALRLHRPRRRPRDGLLGGAPPDRLLRQRGYRVSDRRVQGGGREAA